MARQIVLCEVAPRDGFQNEKTFLEPGQRHESIQRLAAAGLRWIEVASFASRSGYVDGSAEDLLRLSSTIPDIRPIVRVLNDRGYERAVNAGARYIRLVVASTDTMNQKNANALPEQTTASYMPIFERARRDGVELTGTIATSFGCPFEGAVDPERVNRLGAQFVKAGAAEVDFADMWEWPCRPKSNECTGRSARIFRRPNRHSRLQHSQHRTRKRLHGGASGR
jgi:hydroxymethylglutaryl-CoA lyase